MGTEESLDALNRVGRALADPTRARIMLSLLDGPAHPAAGCDENANPCHIQ